MKLRGKVALITGSATGLGRAVAKLFAEEGAKVVVADIKDKEGRKVVKEIKESGGEATFIRTDVSKVSELEMMVKKAVDTYGKLDIFYHNAGIPGPGFIERTSEEDYDMVMAVNLKAAFFGAKYAILELRKAKCGCILFTGSGASFRPAIGSPSYSMTKAALVMLARCLAYYLGDDNIRVNCVCPGIMKTPAWPIFMSRNPEMAGRDMEKFYMQRRAIKRFGTVEEVAQAALFLASDDASYITATALMVDGGGAGG